MSIKEMKSKKEINLCDEEEEEVVSRHNYGTGSIIKLLERPTKEINDTENIDEKPIIEIK